MKDLLDLVLLCNKDSFTKMESSLRVFHWFIIQNCLKLNENNNELKNTMSDKGYSSLELIRGDTRYIEAEGTKGNRNDGVFKVNNSKDIMVEIKVDSNTNQKGEEEVKKQLNEYLRNITKDDCEWKDLLFIVFCSDDNNKIKYRYINEKDDKVFIDSDWKVVKDDNNEDFDWLNALIEKETEILEFFKEKQALLFRYEGLTSALLALYLHKNNTKVEIKKKDKSKYEIEKFCVGVEVNYESNEKGWPNELKNRKLSSARQADVFIIDKSHCGFIIEVKKSAKVLDDSEIQFEHYKYYCEAINNNKIGIDKQSIHAYPKDCENGLLKRVLLYKDEQNNPKEIKRVKLLYLFSCENNLKTAFEEYYEKNKGNKTVLGLAETLFKNTEFVEF